MRQKLRIELNGTDVNPYHQLGLTQNPFPQIAKYETDKYVLHLQKLGGDPIPDTDYIRKHLKDWDEEFVNLLCRQFTKDKIVRFTVEWDEPD